MTRILKQSTGVDVRIGPFVDVGDGFTPETGITLGAADEAEALRAGTATLDISALTWAAVTGADGWYTLSLSTTATNTVGELVIVVQDDSVCLPVWASFYVVEEAVYDAFFAASAGMAVTLAAGAVTAAVIATGAIDADAIADNAIDSGAIASGAITAAKFAAGAIDAAAIADAAIDAATFAAGAITASAIAADAIGASELAADAVTEIANAVWDMDATGHQTQGTFGQAIGDPVADTGTIFKAVVTDATGVTVGTDTATLLTRMGTPSDLGGGATLAGNLSDIEAQTDDIGVAGAGLTALATAANLATVAGYLDTEIAAILADTNELQTDWVNGGRLDLILDARASQTSVDTIDGIVDDILLDTAEIGAAGAGLTNINLPNQTMDIVGNITGNLSGSVGSVSGAVGSVTGAVGSVTGNVGGNVTGTIGGLTAAALKDFFDTDSATTYASAVAGSVVKEIADNAGGSALSEAGIAAAVWDLDATGHQTQGTFGQAIGDPAADANTIYGAVVTGAAGATVAADIIAVKAETASILTDTAEIGAAGAGLTNINLPNQTMDIVGNITGNLSGSVGSVTGAVGSVTGAVGSVTGLTASDVGAIKTKTDSLTYTVAGQVDANIQYVNDVAVTGDGQAGTEWGP